MPSANGLERTLRLLTKTSNPAAIEVLDAGLRSDEPAVRAAAARALAHRRGTDAGIALLRAFAETPPDVQQAALESDPARRLRPAATAALKGDDHELSRRACAYADASGDLHLLPLLVDAARQGDRPHKQQLATTALKLARALAGATDLPAVEGAPREDPAFARRAALTALTRALDEFASHNQAELVEAFLTLVLPGDLVLRRVLEDHTHRAHRTVCDLLLASASPPIMRLVVQTLTQEHPPKPLLHALTTRKDRAFVKVLLDELGERPPLRALEAARELRGFAWAAEDCQPMLLGFSGQQQATAVRLLAETHLSKRRLTDLAAALLAEGEVAGRVAACGVVGKVNAKVSSDLMRQALQDEHPAVVAAAASQLRRRGFEGSTETLIELLDHESEQVRESAQHELKELSYEEFKRAFDKLDDQQQATQGRLVAKADPHCAEKARRDLMAPTPELKLQALERIDALGLGDALSSELIELLHHESVAIRAAAAKALGGSTSDESIAALTAILEDVNATVREVARSGLGSAAHTLSDRNSPEVKHD